MAGLDGLSATAYVMDVGHVQCTFEPSYYNFWSTALKILIVRAAILALSFTGLTASAVVSQASSKHVVKTHINCVGGSTPLCGPRNSSCGGMD